MPDERFWLFYMLLFIRFHQSQGEYTYGMYYQLIQANIYVNMPYIHITYLHSVIGTFGD